MAASSDEMPKDQGEAVEALADTLFDKLNALIKERERLWMLAAD
jgi:hypothetical protein